MLTYRVTDACAGCGACLRTCPESAIRPSEPSPTDRSPLVVLTERCTACGECLEICPADAIECIGGVA